MTKTFSSLPVVPSKHPGIVYCPQRMRSLGQIIEGLALIYEVYLPDEMMGRVEYL